VSGEALQAQKWLEEMLEAGFDPEHETYSDVIRCLQGAGMHKEAVLWASKAQPRPGSGTGLHETIARSLAAAQSKMDQEEWDEFGRYIDPKQESEKRRKENLRSNFRKLAISIVGYFLVKTALKRLLIHFLAPPPLIDSVEPTFADTGGLVESSKRDSEEFELDFVGMGVLGGEPGSGEGEAEAEAEAEASHSPGLG